MGVAATVAATGDGREHVMIDAKPPGPLPRDDATNRPTTS